MSVLCLCSPFFYSFWRLSRVLEPRLASPRCASHTLPLFLLHFYCLMLACVHAMLAVTVCADSTEYSSPTQFQFLAQILSKSVFLARCLARLRLKLACCFASLCLTHCKRTEWFENWSCVVLSCSVEECQATHALMRRLIEAHWLCLSECISNDVTRESNRIVTHLMMETEQNRSSRRPKDKRPRQVEKA